MLGAAVVVLAVIAILQVDAGPPPVVRGAIAPDFRLPVLDEAEGTAEARLSLASLRGRVVLVNFWATWCEPCEREMPAMERLYERLPRDDFELVAVAIDDAASPVERFQEEYQLSFPIVLDLDQSVYQAYQTMGVPESMLLDREGRVVERYVGPREWDAPEHVERLDRLIRDDGA